MGPMCRSDGCTSQFGRPGSLDSPFSRPRPGVVDMVRICCRKSRVPSRVAPGTRSDSPLLWYQAVPGRLVGSNTPSVGIQHGPRQTGDPPTEGLPSSRDGKSDNDDETNALTVDL
eukprot:scaffold561_cov380-Pavlova_lutheri.AAC.11